jgi:hypothetical protein
MIILLSGCYSVLKCAFMLSLTIFLRCLSILSVYYLSLVLCSRFAGYLAINASLTSYIRSSLYVGVLEMVWEYLEVCYPYLALFLVSFHSLSRLTTRSFRSDPSFDVGGRGTRGWEAHGWGIGVPERFVPRDRGVHRD